MSAGHAWRCLVGILVREGLRFLHQRARLIAALVRPLLWLLVFAVGLGTALGEAVLPPYESRVPYGVYILPGLVGMVLLFNGMQSSLSMVYDREMGSMRTLLVSPLPRWYLLVCKLLAGTLVSVAQVYAFLAAAALFGIAAPWLGYISLLPALLVSGLMLGAFAMWLSSAIKQLENFAGVMNFVIFPMFFLSSALYPLSRLGAGGGVLYWLAAANPFTHAVELIRFALYGRLAAFSALYALAALALFLGAAVYAYDPARGMMSRRDASMD
jgi:ABC-2 type transport system permease protein